MDDEEFVDRVVLLLLGGLLLRIGFMVWGAVSPGAVVEATGVVSLLGLGLLLIVSSVINVDLERWGKVIAAIIVADLTLVFIIAIVTNLFPSLGSDAMLFANYSTHLVLAGENPYVAGMEGAWTLAGQPFLFVTAKIDGTVVESLSYPAGSVLVFLPAALLDVSPAIISVLGATAVAALLIVDAPPRYAVVSILAMLIARNVFYSSAGGVFDMLWVFPVLVSMRFWYQERWTAAAVAFGIAASIKQTPWAILPFLAVWTWRVTADWRAFVARASRLLGAGLATFFAINLPFLVDAPRAWLQGILTPLANGAALVHQGLGITLVTSVGIYPLTTSWHALAVLATALVLLTAYTLYFDELRWAAWVLPVAIYAVHYRSLFSYFVSFVPIAMYALLAEGDRLQVDRPESSSTKTTTSTSASRPMVSRRQLLASVATVAGLGTLAAAPAAHARATLDADLEVLERHAADVDGDAIDELVLQLTNHSDDVIEPAVIVWGEDVEIRRPWRLVDEDLKVAPGETETFAVVAPHDISRLDGEGGQIVLFDEGTEARMTVSVPSECTTGTGDFDA